MPLTSESELKDRGWEEPLDESPVDIPDGWSGGTVAHEGGGIYCRSWTTRTDAQLEAEVPEPDFYYKVAYDRDFDAVTVDVYQYRPDAGSWERFKELERRQCPKNTDRKCAAIAAELIARHAPPSA